VSSDLLHACSRFIIFETYTSLNCVLFLAYPNKKLRFCSGVAHQCFVFIKCRFLYFSLKTNCREAFSYLCVIFVS